MERAPAAALRIALIYLALGLSWIYFSDSALEGIVGADLAELSRLQSYKGWFYVVFTSLLLFFLTYASLRRIESLQERDPLTNLLRNAPFKNYLDHMLDQGARENQAVLILCLNIDKFNELIAHSSREIADAFLVSWGDILREKYQSDVLLSRLSSDEFGLALRLADDTDDLRRAATNKLRHLFNEASQEHSLSATCSIGAALAPSDGDDADILLSKASHALQAARSAGAGRTNYFNAELSRQEQEESELLENLLEALEMKQLSLVYQPQFRLDNQSVSGCEVLVRWTSERLGRIRPDRFIPLAERHQIISQITDFVITRASEELGNMGVLAKQLPRVSVNISAQEFTQCSFETTFTDLLKRAEALRPVLQLEITETAALLDLQTSTHLMRQLSHRGLRFSIDDFGTGYSSLAMIKDLPINELKIDRSFVTHISSHPRSAAIIKAMIELARTFDISVVAEGVETHAQQQLLQDMGCSEAQGWLLASPMPAAEFHQFLQRR